MAALGQTIMVVNKSGKVVSTSKHLVSVFKEAKASYQERKAELRQARELDAGKKRSPIVLDDSPSEPSSRQPSRQSSRRSSVDRDRHNDHERHPRPSDHHRRRSSGSMKPLQRSQTDGPAHDRPRGHHSSRRSPTSPTTPPSPLRREAELERESRNLSIARRHSYDDEDGEYHHQLAHRHAPRRASTAPLGDIDMDLAYGDEPSPPPLPVGHARAIEQEELRVKATGLQRLLEELNCLHHSVTQTIKSLEKNPEAMAAVALTLAEISNLATKMAPGALSAMKGSFPAVAALLASPQFLIAAGVGVGLTVVALGGYKIIKKINGKKEEEKEAMVLEEIPEVNRIEHWRRGITLEPADDDAVSLATSVEGEFVTPRAGVMLREQGLLQPKEEKKSSSKEKKEKDKSSTRSDRDKKSRKGDKERKDRKSKSERSDKSSRRSDDTSSRSERKSYKDKDPSGLRMIFKKDQ